MPCVGAELYARRHHLQRMAVSAWQLRSVTNLGAFNTYSKPVLWLQKEDIDVDMFNFY